MAATATSGSTSSSVKFLSFPNTPARVRAVRFHDLHHVLTGYKTDAFGEFEISAWEIGAGCADFLVAWQLNLMGLATGTLLIPRKTFHAFLRGRRSRTLYRESYDALLPQSVDTLRAHTGLHNVGEPVASAADYALFAASFVVGSVVGLISVALLPLLLVSAPFMWAAAKESSEEPVFFDLRVLSCW